jgi:hypothetical protein
VNAKQWGWKEKAMKRGSAKKNETQVALIQRNMQNIKVKLL